eukprot:4315074-Pleurochrysis_carterae.AAC.1
MKGIKHAGWRADGRHSNLARCAHADSLRAQRRQRCRQAPEDAAPGRGNTKGCRNQISVIPMAAIR